MKKVLVTIAIIMFALSSFGGVSLVDVPNEAALAKTKEVINSNNVLLEAAASTVDDNVAANVPRIQAATTLTCTNNCSLTLTNGPYKVHGSGLAENYTVTVDRIYGTEGCFVTLYGSTTASNVVGIATSAYLKLAGDVVFGANDNLMLYFATNNYAIQVGGVTNLD